MVSEKSVVSPYCLEELNYAIKRNRPILPFILDDHTGYALPQALGRGQWYVHDGDPANMLAKILGDCEKIDWSRYQDRSVQRPPEPNSDGGSIPKQFQQAVTLAAAGQFEQAFTRFRNIQSLDPSNWGEDCERWIVRITVYGEVAELTDHPATLKKAWQKWTAHLQVDAESSTFDPLLILSKIMDGGSLPVPPLVAIVSPPPLPAFSLPLLEWIDIPAGEFLMGSDPQQDEDARYNEQPQHSEPVAAFKMSKYPVTYAQYERFVDDEGYGEQSFWTEAGWDWRGTRNEPDYWKDPKWHQPDHPVIGVRWYEAVAFCNWLTAQCYPDVWAACRRAPKLPIGIANLIRLPTEAEWEKSARWDARKKKSLIYPYGDTYDPKKANTADNGIGQTTPVTAYPKGVSPYGVWDMSGNVCEWCLTEWRYSYSPPANNNTNGTLFRVRRGSSWNWNGEGSRGASRIEGNPGYWNAGMGFRLARS
jgi:formylglycine-generating enzyme required for sulfatase activity